MKKLSLLALAFVLMPQAASAGSRVIPNGPWVEDSQEVKLERLHDYEELVAALKQIRKSTDGAVRLEVIGQTNEARDIYLAKVGSGPRKVLYVTQQHGNEPLGTEAALQVLQKLGSSSHPEIKEIRRELTFLIVVRANPDGAERNWRYNYDPDATPEFGRAGQGYDINRYHNPGLLPEANPVPEAAAIRRVYDRYRPELVLDYHHQGTYASEDGDMIKTSVFWPNAAGAPQDAVDYSKQTCVLIFDTLMHYGFAEVSQYPGGTYEGIARNGYGLMGSGSVLIELRGGIGQKSSGMLMRTAYASMFAVLEGVAERSVYDIDPAAAEEIPLRGPFVSQDE